VLQDIQAYAIACGAEGTLMILGETEVPGIGRKLKKLNYMGAWEELQDAPSQIRLIRVDR